jgi:hypothetical protein
MVQSKVTPLLFIAMSNNTELTELLSLELGTSFVNRRPYAKEVFKWQDIDLLPHSSTDTLLCEIYEWDGRNWRTTNNNLIGYIFPADKLPSLTSDLKSIPKAPALLPDFEFTKDQIIDLGLNIPSLFNIGFTGKVSDAKHLSVVVKGVTKSRITNIDATGISIMKALSEFAQNNPKDYRQNIKRNYLAKALFYADTVEISMEKGAGVDIGVSFDLEGVEVKVKADTETKKEFVLKYTSAMAPFAANFVKGKDF